MIAVLTPWNDPYPAAAGLLAAALVTGNTVVHKPSERSPRAGAALADRIAAALPAIAWGLTLTNAGLAEDITAHPIRIEHGYVTLSDAPGLGVEVDEDRVRRYRRRE